ncbi:hypothetical protein TNCV_3215221 [Trichonephila clavipes]|nr:hypothetical protein TNCV_3215221 [Trichonephila clavipes]
MGYELEIRIAVVQGIKRVVLRVCDLDQIGHKIVSIVGQMKDERKKCRREEAARPEQDACRYNLKPRRTDRAESRSSSEQIKDQRAPVWSRGRREQYRPYYKEQGCKQQSRSQNGQETKRGRSSCQNSRSRRAPQQ